MDVIIGIGGIIYIVLWLVIYVKIVKSIIYEDFTTEEKKFIIQLLSINIFGFQAGAIQYFGYISLFVVAFWIFNTNRWQSIIQKSRRMKTCRILMITEWILLFCLNPFLASTIERTKTSLTQQQQQTGI